MAVLVLSIIGVFIKDQFGGHASSATAKSPSAKVPDINLDSPKEANPIFTTIRDFTPPAPTNMQAQPSETIFFRVVGVARDDMLNVRASPGANSPIAGQLPADAAGIQVTGRGVSNGQDFWVPIQTLQISGWVNYNYLQPQ